MTCLPNWTVLYPIVYLESSSHTTHGGFRNQDAANESVPYLEVQEEAPDSNSDGRALEAEPDGLEVENLRWVDLTNWEIRLIYLIFMLWHYWLYISSIWRCTDFKIHLRIFMLKIRNFYTAIVEALEQVPYLTSTLRRSSTLNPFGSASSCAPPSGLESGDLSWSSG